MVKTILYCHTNLTYALKIFTICQAILTGESEGLSLATTVIDLLSKPVVARGGTGGVTELEVVPRGEGA